MRPPHLHMCGLFFAVALWAPAAYAADPAGTDASKTCTPLTDERAVAARERAHQLFGSGRDALIRGVTAAARRDLEEALRLNPEHADARLLLAGLLIREGRVGDADVLAAPVIRERPGDALPRLVDVHLTAARGAVDEAVTKAVALNAAFPEDERLAELAALDLAARDPAAAVRFLEAAVGRRPAWLAVRAVYADALYRSGLYTRAFGQYRILVTHGFVVDEAPFRMVESVRRMADPAPARAFLNEAAEKQRTFALVRAGLAVMDRAFDTAGPELTDMLQRADTDHTGIAPEVHYYLGRIAAARDEQGEAHTRFRAAAAAPSGRRRDFLLAVARAGEQLGDKRLSLDLYRRLVTESTEAGISDDVRREAEARVRVLAPFYPRGGAPGDNIPGEGRG